MYLDFSKSLIVGYFLMIIFTSALAYLSRYSSKPIILILIGNVLSFVVSYLFVRGMAGVERWSFYFKPLAAENSLILISFINLIPQLITSLLFTKNKKAVKS